MTLTKPQILGAVAALALVAGAGGFALSRALPSASHTEADGHAQENGAATAAPDNHQKDGGKGHDDAEGTATGKAQAPREGEIQADNAQVAAAGIKIAEVTEAQVGAEVLAAGTLIPATDATGHVTARTIGTVTRLIAKLGDSVRAGQGLAVIDSREVAEAQAAYAIAVRSEALARATFQREETLYQQKVIARADYDQARAAYDKARIEAQLGAEAVRALGVQPGSGSRLFTLVAPVSGEVASVSITPGEFVSPERELFQVVNRREVWAELRIPAAQLANVRSGQQVRVSVQGSDHDHPARIRFLSPSVDTGSGSARAIATVQNPDGELRVGQTVTARIATGGAGPLKPAVPRSALQDVEGKQVVFVRTATGFEVRPVTIGAGSDAAVPILSGLKPGEQVAVANTFVLKAELGKSEAEHAH